MTKESSAGMIVYNPKLSKFLLLEDSSHWGFAKGGIETGEDEGKAAKRELKEETGIDNFKLVNNFLEKINYYYKKEGKTVYKEVVFFLVLTETEDVKISEEHKNYKWCSYEEAHKLIGFKNTRQVLKKANDYIMKEI
ncbi:MAG: NUDIX domain-containing protein [Nanoarchaeota archaeon]